MTPSTKIVRTTHLFLRTAQLCFFLSGLSALIYEVVWLEKIQLLMGHTVYGLAATLAAYLSGLGLGAIYAPALIRRLAPKHPITLYILAEIGIAIYALLFPVVFQAVTLPYELFARAFPDLSLQPLAVVQFFVAALALIPPTFLMGTTLPVLTHALFSKKEETSRHLAGLYAINTLGAALGSAVTAYLLIPQLGFQQTLLAAFACNLLLAVIAWAQIPQALEDLHPKALLKRWLQSHSVLTRFRHSPLLRRMPKERSRWERLEEWSALAVLLVSGFVTLNVQLVWNRLASLSFGPSITIFALVTAILLLGLAVGAALAQRWIQKGARAMDLGFTLSPFVAAVALTFGSDELARAPDSVLAWHLDWTPSFTLYSLLSGLKLATTIGLASIGLGLLFPFAFSLLTAGTEGLESLRRTSRGYALNILGLLLGSFLGSFLIIPNFGVEGLLRLTTSGLVAIGILIGGLRSQRSGFAVLSGALAASLIVALSSPWDLQRLTSGYFYNRARNVGPEALSEAGYTSRTEYAAAGAPRLVEYQDDVHATISIHEYPGRPSDKGPVRLFKINGKVDGNTHSDLVTTRSVTLAPLLVRDDYQKALVIGLGTGSTAALALQYPQLGRLDVVELSSSLANFSKKYFRGTDGDLFADPRTRLIVRDGREFLQHSSETYDLILSEPSNPWVAGVASLFTREAFQQMAARLDPVKGIAAVWFHAYNLDCPAVYSVFQAAREVFPSIALIKNGNDYYLLGALTPQLPYRALSSEGSKFLAKYGEVFSMKNAELLSPSDLQSRILHGHWIANSRHLAHRLDQLPSSLVRTNSDEHPILQYRSGKTFFSQTHCRMGRDEIANSALQTELQLLKSASAPVDAIRSLATEKAGFMKPNSDAIRTF